MRPAIPSQPEFRPDERRRNARHKTASIIFVQIGSENGGIITDLGIDGVACHTWQKITADKNSTLNLRFHGAGLKADLIGELVWLGGTEKEAGFCFKDLSSNAQKDIADWIAGEAQSSEPAPKERRLAPKPTAAMPGIAAADSKSMSRALSAPSGISRAISAERIASSNSKSNESGPPAPSDSASRISGITPLPEIALPKQGGNLPTNQSDGHSQGSKTDKIEPANANQLHRLSDHLADVAAAEQWIPPAILSAWKRGNRLHRYLLAGAAAACLGILVLTLSLTVAYLGKSFSRRATGKSFQQSTAPPAGPNISPGSLQNGPSEAPPPAPAAVQSQSIRPPATLLANLEKIVFGHELGAKADAQGMSGNVQVWTTKSSGYFYCADSPFFKTIQPGAFMTQGDALQNGYRPKLGRFCE